MNATSVHSLQRSTPNPLSCPGITACVSSQSPRAILCQPNLCGPDHCVSNFDFFHRFWRFSISKNNGQASLIALKNPNGGSRHLVFLETKWYKRGFLLEGASLHQRTKLDEDSSIRGVVTHFDEVEDGCCHPWILVRCMLFSVDVICYFVLSYKMWEN